MPSQPRVESALQLYALDTVQVTVIRFWGFLCVLIAPRPLPSARAHGNAFKQSLAGAGRQTSSQPIDTTRLRGATTHSFDIKNLCIQLSFWASRKT